MLLPSYLNAIENLNPGKIFVENVRSLFNISRIQARTLCEMAVGERLFVRKIGLVCPDPECNERIIAEFDSFEEIPSEIICKICEAEDRDKYVYKSASLTKVEFYKLNT